MVKSVSILVWFGLFLSSCAEVSSQTFATKKASVHFSSNAPEEKIEANTSSVAAQLVYEWGAGKFLIPVKSFTFKKALMQEHFNENYMESERYPRAAYKYQVAEINKVNLQLPGTYKVLTKGVLTIKSVSKQVEVWGQIIVLDEQSIRLEADFSIAPADYGIQIPSLLGRKIAKLIDLQVIATLSKL